MYDRLKSWVFERGGRLMYLGGNGLNCDVEFLDESTCIYRNEDCRQLTRAGVASSRAVSTSGTSPRPTCWASPIRTSAS